MNNMMKEKKVKNTWQVIFVIGVICFTASFAQNLMEIQKELRITAELEKPENQYHISIDGESIEVAKYKDVYYVRENGEVTRDNMYLVNGAAGGLLIHKSNGKEEYFSNWSITATNENTTKKENL